MSKIIKINESQRKRLFEAYREGFSFKELSALGNDAFSDWNDPMRQYEYCEHWLGAPSSRGSSRAVFMLSDNIVLKLAFGVNYEAGKDQNKLEYDTYMKYKTPLLPRVFDCDENFTYLVCENVLPCDEDDFEEIIGIPFYCWRERDREKISVNNCLYYMESNYVTDEPYTDEKIESVINQNPWLSSFQKFVKEAKISDFQLDNFGIVNRDGNVTIVLLDCGMNMDVWEKYYSH